MAGKIQVPLPVVLGHEAAGRVEATGPGVDGGRVGEHVVLTTLAHCGTCPECARGRPTMCAATWGRSDTPLQRGGRPVHKFAALSTFADQVVVSAAQAVPIPPEVPFASAALIGCCVLTGAGAVLNRARVRPGDTVAVIGAGGVGLNVLQTARIAGASRIIAIDTNPAKATQARRFGATDTLVGPEAADAVTGVRDLTGRGVDHVFECVGLPELIRAGADMLAPHGQLVLLGVGSATTEFTLPLSLMYLDKAVLGCRYGSAQPAADVQRYVEFYRSGLLLLDELVTRTYPIGAFDSAVEDARAGRLDRGVLVLVP
ncbi:Zn-dependent alcohol dehydrogenase [Pseudonocardia xishanensis]|uniref:Zn-dependent alcohol dehydrogenase n=2 Tax=Pseudonocardia xishanensis TaxID=630995 RepID=A0ABP8S1X1_9PSEU